MDATSLQEALQRLSQRIRRSRGSRGAWVRDL